MTRKAHKNDKKKTVISEPINRLALMLQYKRPANSPIIGWFISEYIESVCHELGGFYDEAQNYIVRIGDNSRVLFSSHTDTVHNSEGTQRLLISGDRITSVKESCLGADDTTGVWLMLEMIQAGVHGLYIFHADEEIGGVGSAYFANHYAYLLQGIDYAIALDRKGTDSIITHQSSGRCCSDDFASSLALLLPAGFIKDSSGTFTDTANYVHLIGECSNISVGYFDQHTSKESQSISHAMALRESLLVFDESKLVSKRKAGEIDPDDYFGFDDSYYSKRYGKGLSYSGKYYSSYGYDDDYKSLFDYVVSNPDEVTDLLESLGYDLPYFTDRYKI